MFKAELKLDGNYDVPPDAVMTVLSADGCTVYMPGDELPIFDVSDTDATTQDG